MIISFKNPRQTFKALGRVARAIDSRDIILYKWNRDSICTVLVGNKTRIWTIAPATIEGEASIRMPSKEFLSSLCSIPANKKIRIITEDAKITLEAETQSIETIEATPIEVPSRPKFNPTHKFKNGEALSNTIASVINWTPKTNQDNSQVHTQVNLHICEWVELYTTHERFAAKAILPSIEYNFQHSGIFHKQIETLVDLAQLKSIMTLCYIKTPTAKMYAENSLIFQLFNKKATHLIELDANLLLPYGRNSYPDVKRSFEKIRENQYASKVTCSRSHILDILDLFKAELVTLCVKSDVITFEHTNKKAYCPTTRTVPRNNNIITVSTNSLIKALKEIDDIYVDICVGDEDDTLFVSGRLQSYLIPANPYNEEGAR